MKGPRCLQRTVGLTVFEHALLAPRFQPPIAELHIMRNLGIESAEIVAGVARDNSAEVTERYVHDYALL